MQTTIGEIVNEIIPFCAKLEMKMFNDIPFISASLKNDHNLTIGNLYVVQTKEYVYSAYASIENIVGKHFFPSGSIYYPIMSESELIPKLFNKEIISRVEENLNLHSFLEYFYRVLYPLCAHQSGRAAGAGLHHQRCAGSQRHRIP